MINKLLRMAPVFALLSPFFAAVPAAAAVEEGTASGKLTVAGKTTPLTHAYARARQDPFDAKKERILVILSDVAIPEGEFLDDFPGLTMAAAGKLHAVEVELSADKSVSSGSLLHEAFTESDAFTGAGTHVYQAKTFDAKTVEGKLSLAKPEEFMKKKFEYSATFSAHVWRRPAPVATGAAAAQTAPGKAVLAFLKAARSGDKAGIKKLMTAEAGAGLDGPNSKQMLESMKTNLPDPATARIDAVDLIGNSAEISVVDKKASSKFKLALDGGQWKVRGVMM